LKPSRLLSPRRFEEGAALTVISFDLVGTLVSSEFIDYFWLEGLPREYAKRKGMPLKKAKDIVLKLYDEIGEDDIRWYLPLYWERKLGVNIEEVLDESARYIKAIPKGLRLLERAASKGRVYILTNTSVEFVDLVFKKLHVVRENVVGVFSCVSHFMLTRKTEKFYYLILKALGSSPENVIHIGDNITYDVKIPRKIGIKAYNINDERLSFLLEKLI